MLGLVACQGSTTSTASPRPSASGTPAPPTPSPNPTATPTPSPQAAPVAVTLIRHTGPGVVASYDVVAFDTSGHVRAKAHAGMPSLEQHLPEVSVAGNSIYYVDGDTRLFQLSLDRSSREVGSLPGGPDDRVMIAVEPGSSGRIAIGVNHNQPPPGCSVPPGQGGYCGGPTTVQLKLGTIGSPTYRVLDAPGDPIGWLGGKLITAEVGFNIQNDGTGNPYYARHLWLVDPVTGSVADVTKACALPSDNLVGPFGPGGIGCQHSVGKVSAIGWDGTDTDLAVPAPGIGGVLSPDGRSAAVVVNRQLGIVSGGALNRLDVEGIPYGWMDSAHLLVGSSTSASSSDLAVLDLISKVKTPLDLAGIEPGYLPPYGAYFASVSSGTP